MITPRGNVIPLSRIISVVFNVMVLVIVGISAKNNPESLWLVILNGVVAVVTLEWIGISWVNRQMREAGQVMNINIPTGIAFPDEDILDAPIGTGLDYLKNLLCKKGVPLGCIDAIAYQLQSSYKDAEWADASYEELKDGLYVVFAMRKNQSGIEFADFYAFLKDGVWENRFADKDGREIPGFVPLIVNASSYVDEEKGRGTMAFVDSLDLFGDDDKKE